MIHFPHAYLAGTPRATAQSAPSAGQNATPRRRVTKATQRSALQTDMEELLGLVHLQEMVWDAGYQVCSHAGAMHGYFMVTSECNCTHWDSGTPGSNNWGDGTQESLLLIILIECLICNSCRLSARQLRSTLTLPADMVPKLSVLLDLACQLQQPRIFFL